MVLLKKYNLDNWQVVIWYLISKGTENNYYNFFIFFSNHLNTILHEFLGFKLSYFISFSSNKHIDHPHVPGTEKTDASFQGSIPWPPLPHHRTVSLSFSHICFTHWTVSFTRTGTMSVLFFTAFTAPSLQWPINKYLLDEQLFI